MPPISIPDGDAGTGGDGAPPRPAFAASAGTVCSLNIQAKYETLDASRSYSCFE
jgi:hypothetical protein